MASVRVILGWLLLVAAFTTIGLLATVTLGGADPYFNSSEPGCSPTNPNPNYILCDDFDNGNWALLGNQNPPSGGSNDKGWLLCNDTGGPTTCRNPPPPAVTSLGQGVGNRGYAAMSTSTGGDGGDSQLGMHGFYPNNATYSHIWIRFYWYLEPGYVANGNQKIISLISSAYSGGIDQGGIGRDPTQPQACPQWTCGQLNEGFLGQNQGNNITIATGRWYYVELEVGVNTFNTRDGIWRMWINDCGTAGTSCGAAPILRAGYTNVGWIGSGTTSSTQIGSLWWDLWGNPADVGTRRIDNLIVSKAGPIGFMGGSTAAPSAPTSTQLH